jgi:hypothetical protein
MRRRRFASSQRTSASSLIRTSSDVPHWSRRNEILRFPDRRNIVIDRTRCSCRRH